VTGFCGHGSEPSGFLNGGEFLDWPSELSAPHEGLCYMELVTVSVVLIQNVARMGHVFQIQCIIRRQNVAIVTTGIRSQFRIADAFPGNPMYCLTLVCKTEWNMKDYTLPSAVGFCWCW
jgi:hypothetical protein